MSKKVKETEIELATPQKTEYELALEARIAHLEAMLQKPRHNPANIRVNQVLSILREGPASIKTIAEKLEITTKNVSSILRSLRVAEYIIHTDEQQRKYLVREPAIPEELPAIPEELPAIPEEISITE